jgi:zinc/manganese transport system substrate-binding protein
MRNIILMTLLLGIQFVSSTQAQAKVNIFACAPEWASLSKEIGGDLVKVYTATKANQDVHYMRAKPSLLAAMRKADLVFCSGASLESGWLPILLQKAGGPDVQAHTTGWLMASDYVQKLEMDEGADRGDGHVHPEGNPHVHLNPHNITKIAAVLADRLYQIDEANVTTYSKNYEDFTNKWAQMIAQWEVQAKPLQGANVVIYHKSWSYLVDWLGLNVVAALEPKPGLPPTAAHLKTVLNSIEKNKARAILIAPYEDEKAAKWLHEKSSIPILRLPYTVGGNNRAVDLVSLFDDTIQKLSLK